MPELTVIVPTYREAENLPELIERVFTATSCADIKAEMLVVDDNSGDGTEHICADMGKKYSVGSSPGRKNVGLQPRSSAASGNQRLDFSSSWMLISPTHPRRFRISCITSDRVLTSS